MGWGEGRGGWRGGSDGDGEGGLYFLLVIVFIITDLESGRSMLIK